MSRGHHAEDITGMRSGMVVALEQSDRIRRGSRLWECKCDCGRVFYTEAYKIRGQKIQSCGCQRNVHQFKDLTGQRFGRLTAIKRLDEKRGKDTSYLWLCRCDCGTEIKASVNALFSGNYTSCGCAKKDRLSAAYKNISGQKFGRLTAIAPTDKRMGDSVVWRCVCDCGKETEVSCNSLVTGNTKSCGCLHQDKPGPPAYMRYIDGTCIENLERTKLQSNNTSGYTGAQYHKRTGKWIAVITFKGKTYNLGKYEKIEEAARVRKQAEERIFGEFLDKTFRKRKKRRSNRNTGSEGRIPRGFRS